MKVKYEDNRIIAGGIKDFNARQVFDCGQCFRFESADDGSYTGTARGRIINVSCEKNTLTIANASETDMTAEEMQKDFENIWSEYFDLERDYSKIKKSLRKRDPIIGKAIEAGEGIRILKQNPWETVVSFIISQNNNIPRIKKCIDSLAENFGQRIGRSRPEFGGREYFDIPSFEVMSGLNLEDLDVCRLGYRSRYLIETAGTIAKDGGKKLYELSGDEAFAYVSSLCGVGPKVANCITLFSMEGLDRFPVDVWIKKIMHEMYGFDEDDMTGMEEFAREMYGKYGGIAQQYLFYYARQ